MVNKINVNVTFWGVFYLLQPVNTDHHSCINSECNTYQMVLITQNIINPVM